MSAHDFQLEARMRVMNFFNDFRLEGVPEMTLDMVYVVWFSKTLQNWKALVSTQLPDGIYYELTYDGDQKHMYLDVYKKEMQFIIGDPEPEDPNQLTIDISEETESGTTQNHNQAEQDTRRLAPAPEDYAD